MFVVTPQGKLIHRTEQLELFLIEILKAKQTPTPLN